MKQLRNIVLLAALLLGGHLKGLGQVFEWAQLARGSERPLAGGTGASTDPAGNTYAAITFTDTLRVGGQTLLATAGNGAVVKYDSTGRVAWVRQLRNVYLQNGIAVDPANGGVFLLGQALPGATWGGVPVAVSSAGSFYAKCSAAGTLQWANPLPLVYGALANQSFLGLGGALTADGLGNCYVMGNVRTATTLNSVSLDTTTTFLMQANPAGVRQWVRVFRASNTGGPASRRQLENVALASKPSGGCAVLGYFGNQVYYSGSGTAPVITTGGANGNYQEAFIGSVDATGNLLWAQPAPPYSVGGIGGGFAQAVAADAAGNLYTTGRFGTGGFGLAKYNATGVRQWVVGSHPASGTTRDGGIGFAVAVDGAGNVTAAVTSGPYSVFIPAAYIGNTLLRSPSSIVRYDAQGQFQWATGDDWQGLLDNSGTRFFPYFGAGISGLDNAGNVYCAGNIVTDRDSLITATGRNRRPAVVLGPHTLVGRGFAVARIGSRHNTISGALYLDQNGNGQRDAGDVAFPQNLVLTTQQANAVFATLDSDASYRLYVGQGAYTLPAPTPPLHYALSQPAAGSYAGSFVGYGRVDTARHFGYRPLPNQADLRLTLTPYGAARPGFLTRYRLTLENVGTTTVAAGTATVALDGRMSYVGSTPAGSRTGQTISWTYTSLAPFARREFDVSFSLPVNTPLGTALSSTGTAPLPADVVPADNSSTATQTVTGSFDPNDISVNYTRLTPTQVAAGQPLDYTIRFQNMGTDTAFTVVIQDTLNFRKLNLGTILLVAQSHNCSWSLSGPGLLTVRFLNIRLPHRGADVIRSQGFVRFRVLPRASLALGDIIPNHADIVFDYNAPIRTNTATTAVLLPTAVAAARPGLAWDVYPNPATTALTIAANLPTGGPVKLILRDALGRPVRQQQLLAPAGPLREILAVQGLAPGVYVLQVALPGGTVSQRVVVE